MKIFIIGAGFTGKQLAKSLVLEGNSVVLIDNDPERVRHASDQLDCTVIEADGNNIEALENAGISSADALVTLTEDDELNMVTCSLVDSLYPDVFKIARVRNYAYYAAADLARRRAKNRGTPGRPLYGIDRMMNPDVEAASAIASALEHGAVGGVIDLEGGFSITTLSVGEGSALAGVPLWQFSSIPGWRYFIAFVEIDGEVTLPNGNTVLKVGDRIGIVSRHDETDELVKFTRTPAGNIRRIVLFGADSVGKLLVARQLAMHRSSPWKLIFGSDRRAEHREIVVVDRDAERCREIIEQFPGARALCGDFTDEALLEEENIFGFDLLVAASGNYELNLLTAAYLKSRGVAKTIALASAAADCEIARKLGIDVAVAMRSTVVDGIMSHLSGRSVKALHSVCNRQFVIVEGDVSARSRVIGRKLMDISDLGEFLVLLVRGSASAGLEMPRGDTVVEKGMHVVLIARSGDGNILERFFGRD